MAVINPIVPPKVTSTVVEANKVLKNHVDNGIKPAPALTHASNGSSLGTQVSGGARISGGRG